MIRKYLRKVPKGLHKLQLLILFHVASLEDWEIITQTDVANALGKPVTTLNYHFKKLKEADFLDKHNKLTNKAEKLLRNLKHWDKTFDRKLRAHKIQIVLFLARCPDLQKIRNIIFTPFTNKRYHGLKCELKGCTIMFYGSIVKKAVAVLPDIYGNTDEEIAAALVDSVSQLIIVLEAEFKGLKVAEYKVAKYSSMHIAALDSIIAESYLLEHKHCYSNGRVAIDSSHGRSELEAESGETAFEDIQMLVKCEEMAKEIERLKQQLKEIESEPKKPGEKDQ